MAGTSKALLLVALGGTLQLGIAVDRCRLRPTHDVRPSAHSDATAESSAAKDATAKVPSAQNVTAFDKANAVLESAIAGNRWTPEDRAAFHDALRGVTREQHRELSLRLVRAINEKSLPYTPSGD
jgi:hypothetical protein